MAIWNRIFGRQESAAGPSEEPEVPESAEFTPRTDGWYRGESPAGKEWIRFTTSTALVGLDAGGSAAGGDYSGSGRFSVQRQFERPIVFTVLSVAVDPDGRMSAFTARRTDTAPGAGVVEVEYVFGTP